MPAAPYSFRPATPDDLAMLRLWLETPEVRIWWGDPDEQCAMLEADLADPRMTMLIVSLDDRPFAYAQHSDVAHWAQEAFAGLPPGTRAIDMFIGVPEMIGRAHGAAVVQRLALDLRACGAPMVVIDPDPENVRARRAYARAGFAGDQVVETSDGPAVLMVFDAARACHETSGERS